MAQESPGDISETSASGMEVDFAEVVGLLHRAGNSCYALANGLLGDSERATDRAEALQEYFESHRSSVGTCNEACTEASGLVSKATLQDPVDARMLTGYAKSIAELCTSATEPVASVKIYGKRVSKASYDVALAESEIERRKGILLSRKKADPKAPQVEGEAEPTEVAKTSEEVEPVVQEAAEPASEIPKARAKVEPPPPKISGDAPAPYWDEERKRKQIQEEARVAENRRIQGERDRIRDEKRERQQRERQQAALHEMRTWYAVYAGGIRELSLTVGEFRAALEGRGSTSLVEVCRKMEDEAQSAIDNKPIFESPIGEVNSLLSSAVRDFRRMATDCVQGRTYQLGQRLKTADDKMVRVEELLRPYRTVG